jgi:acetoin:2,6-dichlorophenolindophenol oxidoreductase subunit beta
MAIEAASADVVTKKYRIAIRDVLAEELEQDPKVILMGQDIGVSNGLFRLTEGLFERFGAERIRDTPISETATVGAAIGLAMLGFRPVVEIAFSDLMLTCFDTIVNQLAKLKWMFGTQGPELKVVIRALTGAGLGVGAHHSQSLEALFGHMPGLNVVMPATPNDAAALLKAALRSSVPSIFLEHKMLLRDSGPVRIGEVARLGQALITREGSDLTLVGVSYTAKLALQAATALSPLGVSAEVIDMRCISPLDSETVVRSVRKTGRLLVVQEAYRPFGVGAEIIASVVSQPLVLRAPPERLAVPFVPIPALKALEQDYLPTVDKIVTAATRLCRAARVAAG